MKKILLLAAVAVSVLFSGCLKSDNPNAKYEPVAPGMRIFELAYSQYAFATEQSNWALHLATLIAEAKVQGKTDLNEVMTSNDKSLKERILGKYTVISTTADGYQIKFNPGYENDSYSREGSILIKTNGADQIEDTNPGSPWIVTFENKLVLTSLTNNGEKTLSLVRGTSKLYNMGNGTYTISIDNQGAYLDSDSNITSDWTGGFTMKPESESFAYSECFVKGKKIIEGGSAVGSSYFNDGYGQPLGLGISFSTVEYNLKSDGILPLSIGHIKSGKITARLLPEYDTSVFPAADVTYSWVSSDNSTGIYIIYNDNTVLY